MSEPTYTDQGAMFDEDRVYRFRLWRVWNPALPRVAFVMLNPSTADERQLDPTLRRCLGFARAWGCGSFEVGNAYALRSTDPDALYGHPDPVGPGNDEQLAAIARAATFGVFVGWGAHAPLPDRTRAVLEVLTGISEVQRLGALTKCGQPRHPLYLAGTTPLEVHAKRRPAS